MTPITSTRVAQILGCSPWGGPWQAWARLTGLVESEAGNASTLRGQILERAVAEHYAQQRGLVLIPGPAYTEPPNVGPEPWMATHEDFQVGPPPPTTIPVAIPVGTYQPTWTRKRWVLEVKTARTLDRWGPDGSADVPIYYAAQCAWHMACLNLDRCDLVVFAVATDEMRTYTLHRDRAMEARLVAHLRGWYERHVVAGEPPEVDASASPVLARLFPGREERVFLDATDEDRAIAAELRELDQQRTIIDGRADLLKARLQQRIGDAYGIDGVCIWAPTKGRDTIDAKALRRDHPAIAEQYTRTGAPSRRFNLTDTDKE
jgi:predicted phage-related endonuclease